MSAKAVAHLREGFAPIRERLVTTAFLAALLHGVIIVGVTFSGGGNPGQIAPGLEVLLVSEDVPEARENESAAYLAQRTQLGSGVTEDPAAARTPRALADAAPQDGEPDGNVFTDVVGTPGEQSSDRVVASSSPQTEVLYFAPPPELTTSRDMPLLVDGAGTENKPGSAEAEEAALRGPKRDQLWTTPDTRAAALAPYLVAWRQKIERLGTLNFPVAARRDARKSNPVLEVAVAADGTLLEAKIRRTSGSPSLDQATLDILKLASPFDPFPKDLAARYRALRFAYEWQFEGSAPSGGSLTAPADSG
jgi:periplasmic protein TonB